MSEHKQLIIFLREPKKGKVKTRLAKSIGEEKALELYEELIELTIQICSPLQMKKELCFSETIQFVRNGFSISMQSSGDLGERMKNSFASAFPTSKKGVVLIGSDCPGLNKELIEEAFRALEEHDLALGPSEDGGYYLIALKRSQDFLFNNMPWGSEFVLKETLNRASEHGLKVHLLEQLFDVDRLADYERYLEMRKNDL